MLQNTGLQTGLAWLTQATRYLLSTTENQEVSGHGKAQGRWRAAGNTAGGSHLEWLLHWHMEPQERLNATLASEWLCVLAERELENVHPKQDQLTWQVQPVVHPAS